MSEPHRIAVYGATGHTGRQVVRELVRRGASPVLLGRDEDRLHAVAQSLGYAEVRAASLDDPAVLRRALENCEAVVNAAGPFGNSAVPVVRAAVDTCTHYLDFTAEQEVVLELFEHWDAPARRANVAVVPAMGFFGALGDLLGSVTASGNDCQRLTIAYAVDGWLLTAGSRATIPFMTGRRRAWRNGVLSMETGTPRSGSFYYPGRGTEAVMEDYPLPEAVTVARHTATPEVRLLMAVKTIEEILSPSAPGPDDVDDQARADSRFLVVAEAEGADGCRRTVARGNDIYGITAPIIVEGALRLIGTDLSGALAPAEAFEGAGFLSSLIPEWLTLEPGLESRGERPQDAVGFVLGAERATNDRDATAAAALYASNATLELVTDGVLTRYRGAAAIGGAWRRLMEVIDGDRLTVRKQLLGTGIDVIVNEWRGTSGHGQAQGTESWFFDAQGKVREHRLLTSYDVRSDHTGT